MLLELSCFDNKCLLISMRMSMSIFISVYVNRVCVCILLHFCQSGFFFRFNEIEHTDARYEKLMLVNLIFSYSLSQEYFSEVHINNGLCSKRDFQIYLFMFHLVVLSLCSINMKLFHINWLKKRTILSTVSQVVRSNYRCQNEQLV